MNIVFLDAQTLGDDLNLSIFNQFGFVKIFQTTSPDEILNRTDNAEILIVNKVKIRENKSINCRTTWTLIN